MYNALTNEVFKIIFSFLIGKARRNAEAYQDFYIWNQHNAIKD